METLSSLASTVIGKVLIWIIVLLSGAIIALGFYTLTVSGERNVLRQEIKTKNTEIAGKVKDVDFMKAWMARDKLDAIKKEADYNRTMAAKPKFNTLIKYVPTGDNCTDLNAIAEEARRNAEGNQL